MMLDFICELERVLLKWPENVSWTLAQIADYTNTGVPQVVDFLSDTLDRELEVHEALTFVEASRALAILKERMSTQLAARQRRLDERREKAIRSYDVTMEKVRLLQTSKNQRAAYKTMSYYVGRHEKDIPEDLLLELCGECLRLGIKAETNLQELSLWLRKGVASCLRNGSPDSIDSVLDFIDAYGEHFLEDVEGRGKRLLGSVLQDVRSSAESVQLNPQFATLVKDLGLS